MQDRETIAFSDQLTPSAEALTRAVRHELGNLLQKLYATVAILQARLPAAWDVEPRPCSTAPRRNCSTTHGPAAFASIQNNLDL